MQKFTYFSKSSHLDYISRGIFQNPRDLLATSFEKFLRSFKSCAFPTATMSKFWKGQNQQQSNVHQYMFVWIMTEWVGLQIQGGALMRLSQPWLHSFAGQFQFEEDIFLINTHLDSHILILTNIYTRTYLHFSPVNLMKKVVNDVWEKGKQLKRVRSIFFTFLWCFFVLFEKKNEMKLFQACKS